jgi:hypothetical protein
MVSQEEKALFHVLLLDIMTWNLKLHETTVLEKYICYVKVIIFFIKIFSIPTY